MREDSSAPSLAEMSEESPAPADESPEGAGSSIERSSVEGPALEGPSVEGPEVVGPPSEGSDARGGGRIPMARRLEDPQRVDGGGRWSVESTRRRCCRCDQPLPDHDTFHTVLEPASAEQLGDEEEREVFVRRDYCEGCFVENPPETFFAHWRRILPPPAGGPRKIVNLASLLAHWHTLVETPAIHDPDATLDGQEGIVGESGVAENSTPDASEGAAPPKLHLPTLSPPRLRLAYLLALFLVRRRMLKWEGIQDNRLQLRCKESDRPVGLPVPPLSDAELEEAVAEFEELFR